MQKLKESLRRRPAEAPGLGALERLDGAAEQAAAAGVAALQELVRAGIEAGPGGEDHLHPRGDGGLSSRRVSRETGKGSGN